MKIKIELNEHDIAKILESYYDSKNIRIYVQRELDGYGPMEHEVSKVHAEVTIDTDQHIYD